MSRPLIVNERAIPMNDRSHSSCPGRLPFPVTRRQMLASTANGFGMLALSGLMSSRGYGATVPAPARLAQPHYKPKVKNVIFCFMDGGVSHVDSFDPKPKLAELDGKPCTES